jgi:Glycosyl hydrolase catalytic core
MQSFAANVTQNCFRMEWVSVHWYGDASVESFKSSMERLHNMYGKPLLVTEFAVTDWSAKTVDDNKWTETMVLNFMKGVIPWLEATPWITGYSWFSFRTINAPGTSAALFDEEGELTTCGRYYTSVRTETPYGDMAIGTDQDPLLFVTTTPTPVPWVPPILPVGVETLLPGKKGAVLSSRGNDMENRQKLLQLNVSWNRNWGLTARIDSQPETVEFVPTLFNGWTIAQVTETLQTQLIVPNNMASGGGSVKRLLGFHGPDNPNQSNMPVELALGLWPALESFNIATLVSPSCFDPFGEWMETFMAGVDQRGLRVDWIGVRWSGYPDFGTLQNDMNALHEKFQRPILLTGLAPVIDTTTGPSAMLAFMKQALPWLEATEYIRGYAWMSKPDSAGALFYDDNSLTALGWYYASISPTRPEGDQAIQYDDGASRN